MQVHEALLELGLSPEATVQDARRRYRQLIKQCHPDTNGGFETRATRLIAAYRVLCDDAESDDPQGPCLRDVLILGRRLRATTSHHTRRWLVRRLAASRLRSAVVFLEAAMQDRDPEVATAAVEGILVCAGKRGEEVLVEQFDRMDVFHRRLVVDVLGRRGLSMGRVVARAVVDTDPQVRARAARIQQAGGRTA